MSQLVTFIIVLVILFVIVGTIMAVSMVRMRNGGRNVSTVTDPIPDPERQNTRTRMDKAADSSYNGTSSDREREQFRS